MLGNLGLKGSSRRGSSSGERGRDRRASGSSRRASRVFADSDSEEEEEEELLQLAHSAAHSALEEVLLLFSAVHLATGPFR